MKQNDDVWCVAQGERNKSYHTHTTQKSRKRVFKILNTICGENCETLWFQVSTYMNQEIRMYNLVIVKDFMQ
jgi:hypothetical protein